ncbi:MAG: hypothetical protein AAF713_07770 [Pseudomonadota bacterium]
MPVTIKELEARATVLQAAADKLGIAWRDRAAALPESDPVAMIGLMADVLELDLHLALDPEAPLPLGEAA